MFVHANCYELPRILDQYPNTHIWKKKIKTNLSALVGADVIRQNLPHLRTVPPDELDQLSCWSNTHVQGTEVADHVNKL